MGEPCTPPPESRSTTHPHPGALVQDQLAQALGKDNAATCQNKVMRMMRDRMVWPPSQGHATKSGEQGSKPLRTNANCKMTLVYMKT